MCSRKSTERAHDTLVQQPQGLEYSSGFALVGLGLGMVDGEGGCAAEDRVVAELTERHAVTVGVPKAAAAHVHALTFLLTHNNLDHSIR